MSFAERLQSRPHDPRDPDPWLALYLDRSVPIDDEAKAALLIALRSRSRQFLLPLVRPLARLAMVLIQVLKVFVPRGLTSSPLLHRLIHRALRTFVAPESNFLILRHFHIGSEVLAFIAANVPGVDVPLSPLRPRRLVDVEDDLFLRHDLNLFNFVIRLNAQLREKGLEIGRVERPNLECITDGPFPMEPFPRRWTNFVDLQTAIEIYTPLYQLLLTDNDFWRASNSLQLDETVGLYVARILGVPEHLVLVNNKHPLVPLSTLMAGYRLMLHGLSAECLHAMLRERKRAAAGG
ncbi:MAG TPA: hypothetical protein VII13_21570 [Vicinamibacteria bacterium]